MAPPPPPPPPGASGRRTDTARAQLTASRRRVTVKSTTATAVHLPLALLLCTSLFSTHPVLARNIVPFGKTHVSAEDQAAAGSGSSTSMMSGLQSLLPHRRLTAEGGCGSYCPPADLGATATPRCDAAKACTNCPYACLPCGSNRNTPQCSNANDPTGVTLPVYNGINTADNDACTDWVGSGARYLTPMYNQGDCSTPPLGAAYGVYDCNAKKICFKASSCV